MVAALLSLALLAATPDTTAQAALARSVDAYLAPFTESGERPTLRIEWTDLTGDGLADALVTVESPSWCGSGGCTLLVVEAMAGEHAEEFGPYRVAAEVAHVNGSVVVLHEATGGWRDLVVPRDDAYAVLQFDGETYPASPADGIAMTGSLPADGDHLFAGR